MDAGLEKIVKQLNKGKEQNKNKKGNLTRNGKEETINKQLSK